MSIFNFILRFFLIFILIQFSETASITKVAGTGHSLQETSDQRIGLPILILPSYNFDPLRNLLKNQTESPLPVVSFDDSEMKEQVITKSNEEKRSQPPVSSSVEKDFHVHDDSDWEYFPKIDVEAVVVPESTKPSFRSSSYGNFDYHYEEPITYFPTAEPRAPGLHEIFGVKQPIALAEDQNRRNPGKSESHHSIYNARLDNNGEKSTYFPRIDVESVTQRYYPSFDYPYEETRETGAHEAFDVKHPIISAEEHSGSEKGKSEGQDFLYNTPHYDDGGMYFPKVDVESAVQDNIISSSPWLVPRTASSYNVDEPLKHYSTNEQPRKGHGHGEFEIQQSIIPTKQFQDADVDEAKVISENTKRLLPLSSIPFLPKYTDTRTRRPLKTQPDTKAARLESGIRQPTTFAPLPDDLQRLRYMEWERLLELDEMCFKYPTRLACRYHRNRSSRLPLSASNNWRHGYNYNTFNKYPSLQQPQRLQTQSSAKWTVAAARQRLNRYPKN